MRLEILQDLFVQLFELFHIVRKGDLKSARANPIS